MKSIYSLIQYLPSIFSVRHSRIASAWTGETRNLPISLAPSPHVVVPFSSLLAPLQSLSLLCMPSHSSHARLAPPRTAACQAPLSMGFSRQEYWSGLPCLPPGDLPNPGIEPTSPLSPALQADSYLLSRQGSPFTSLHKPYCRVLF